MFIDDFIWLPEILDKLDWKHHLNPDEVEEVFFNQPRFRFHQKGKIKGEDLYMAMGQTEGGRYLIVYFIFKFPHCALVISAREMENSERKAYERK